ncbi:MAG: B12-binding domain-containing radical SAM protein [Planctomycetes bacterium]|nr:B12-binding domain-containing radical SAM protein [Planctomycetota bacterium]
MARALFVFSVQGSQRFPRRPIRAVSVQLGISYIAGMLRQHGHETSLLVLKSAAAEREFTLVEQRLREFRPDLVCHTAVCTQYPFIASVARHIRGLWPRPFQVVGGPHVSLNPEQALADGFDAVCIGEGEYPTLELATQLDQGRRPSRIDNLWFRKPGGVARNGTRSFVQELDQLPLPQRDMWAEWIEHRQSEWHTLLLGRGCPFCCPYCCNHALRRLADGQYVRMRSVASIAREIEALEDLTDPQQRIWLEVETIMLYPEWAEELCAKLAEINARRPTPICFGTNVRVIPKVDYERFFRAFQRANICQVNIGLESGSERIRRDVLKRRYSNEDVLRVVRAARAHNIAVKLYNLVGLPGETFADFLETARMNWLCQPDDDSTSIFFPYPGTELHRLAQEQGLLPAQLDVDRERLKATLDLPGFPNRRIQQCYDWFPLFVAYAGRPRVQWLRITIARGLAPFHSLAQRLPGYWFFRTRLAALARLRRANAARRPPSLDHKLLSAAGQACPEGQS